MTEKQAIALSESGFYKTMTHKQISMFQMFERRLCMPFNVFHEALEKTLGRPVYTHELGFNAEGIKKELLGEKEPPTLEEIINMIPEDKRILVVLTEETKNAE